MDSKPFLCDFCCEAFTALDALSEHKQQEHKENCLFICCHCKEVFTVEEELNEHIQANTCKYLDSAVETGTQRYMSKNTTVTDKKPYLCEICSEALTDLDSFISHKEGHIKKQLFVCSKCKSVFNVEEDLNSHLENHKPPYSDIIKHNDEESDAKYSSLTDTCCNVATQNGATLTDVKTEQQSD